MALAVAAVVATHGRLDHTLVGGVDQRHVEPIRNVRRLQGALRRERARRRGAVPQMPLDRVGFGSKVEIHDLSLDEKLSLTVVAGDYMDLDGGHVSMASPIGKGLLGARKDEEVVIQLPVGERRFRILELLTLPEQLSGEGV